ncbi:hypothetical protein ACOMHN_062526 [Nucella lapillus]
MTGPSVTTTDPSTTQPLVVITSLSPCPDHCRHWRRLTDVVDPFTGPPSGSEESGQSSEQTVISASPLSRLFPKLLSFRGVWLLDELLVLERVKGGVRG